MWKAKPEITVIGGGLAGCEAAWHLASRGFFVRLLEPGTTPTRMRRF
jgi:folate-dependent tRNA-U54 methylase TrmFO/GidA